MNRDFATKIKSRYSPVPSNEDEKIIDGIQSIIAITNSPGRTTQSISDHTARIIYRLFDFKEISIIVKSDLDGQFRYESMIGFRKDAEQANKKLVFSPREIMDAKKFPHAKIGRFSEYHEFEEEEVPDEIRNAYNRPSKLSEERESEDQYLEGDYIDIDITGYKKQLLGWVELGNARSGKLPSRETLWWIELIANILGMTIAQRKLIEKRING